MKVDFSTDEIKIFDFNELEAYRIARKLENDGLYFYTRLKEEVSAPRIREVVDMLIRDEKKHVSTFEEKVEDLCREQKVIDEGETLADIVDSHVMDTLKDAEQVADILCNPQEALKLGISTEQRSIAFYNNLLQNTSDEAGREALAEIICEEEEHLDKLKGLLRQ